MENSKSKLDLQHQLIFILGHNPLQISSSLSIQVMRLQASCNQSLVKITNNKEIDYSMEKDRKEVFNQLNSQLFN
jgi:hypothetical protein